MDKQIKFSIIIPAYNTEKYISKCIKSVLNQTYDNFEAIIIDDGSTDGTKKILDTFAEKNSKIKVFHQSNAGVSLSRKKAINLAHGDYITFLDSDDWYSPDYLSCVYNKISEDDYSILQVGFYKVRFGLKKNVSDKDRVFISDDNLIKDYINGHGVLSYSIGNKIYKTSIIKNAINKNKSHFKIGEDAVLNLIALSDNKNEKICIIDKPLYYYRQGSGVSSSKNNIMVYAETMKYKLEIYNYAKDFGADKSLLKSIFIDIAFITQYYSILITDDEKNRQKQIQLLDEVIFNNPTIMFLISIYSSEDFTVPQCSFLLLNDAEKYFEYIDKVRKDFSLTLTQKILKILS